jgi:molecular chaperone GrpE
MAAEQNAEVSDADKNQNEQSSADLIDVDDDQAVDLTPEVLDYDDDPKVIDLDTNTNFSLEDLIKRASNLGRKPKPVQASPVVAADPPAVGAATPPVEDGEQITLLKAQIEQEKTNTLRALADLQNLRRRSDEERLRIIRDGNERLIKEFLPVLDDFERGLAATRTTQSYEQLIDGVDSVLRKFSDILTRQGVEAIPAVGEPFNPDLHEAVSVEEGSDETDEVVTQELRKGYTLHGRVIRPSLVTVAKS